ncbi:bifunctional folylpolyglutamate synthase/dihydrofolate synthase [Evansella clarkii]|uniref:bifunctional folylpolyglutamate synthase/dihydrofolate synthase n=1 Tax=Evansella clarkii TaxID=79879 RepID=UPI000997D2B6|nr:folylpolyglutamate synthase/dihydrofolate synthase family protein [Evansella clarkii]
MIRTYEEAQTYLQWKQEAGIRFDLKRMRVLMEKLRHPERRVKTIHVAGTNGKGSTVTYLRSMLERAEFFIGTFMTPVFGDTREQIAINGIPIGEEEFAALLSEIEPGIQEAEAELGETISEFEVMTAAALYFFSFKKAVDLAIIETGMGGKNDATNVIVPLVSIITNVAEDHKEFLGDSISEIAREKAGIIKAGIPVITGSEGEALEVIKKEAGDRKSKVYSPGEQFSFHTDVKDGKQVLTYEASYRKLDGIPLKMAGEHQAKNAALAVVAADYLKQFYALMVDDEQVIEGLKKAELPGRFERISESPVILLDTAHNPAAIETAVKTVNDMFQDKPDVLFAAMKDKDIQGMVEKLAPSANTIFYTDFLSPRALPADKYDGIAGGSEVKIVEHPEQWVSEWQKKNTDAVLLITGSHQFIGEMRKNLI